MARRELPTAMPATPAGMPTQEKLRVRVQAGSELVTKKAFMNDSFQNFQANLGLGTNNLSSSTTYGFYALSRNRLQLEWMYRGSWLVKQIIDAPADDMTRAGISYATTADPQLTEKMTKLLRGLGVWKKINLANKWARLYGGACAWISIDGQNPKTPLRIDTVGKDAFKGLIVLDRWMLWPDYSQLVNDAGPDFGMPMFYDVVADGMGIPRQRIHYSRLLRFEGIELPYWSRMQENGWSLSVIEPLYDRMIAFDSTTTGVAQLVYKAHLRTYKIPGLRELVAAGGPIYQALLAQIALMRAMQSNEGITLIDGEDEFEAYSYTFAGLTDVLMNQAQQLSGGSQIPLTRLFGQAPAGLNATGDSDMRNYYDMIKSTQEARLREPVSKILQIAHRSLMGAPLPDDFDFEFNSLWQMTDQEKADMAFKGTQSIVLVKDEISQQVFLKELRQLSRTTGIFTNISDEDIEAADDEPPDPVQNAVDMQEAMQPGIDASGDNPDELSKGKKDDTGATAGGKKTADGNPRKGRRQLSTQAA
jgi:uncharacterized protein